ncbi:MAG: hypothetical protein ACOX75_06875 [Lachnospiraceae bacterium]|jgi:predicted MPP superfamily phosphohydrolase
MKPWLIIVIILAMLVVAAIARCIYELYSLEVNRYVIHASGLRERFRLVFISDLHGRVYGRGNEKLLSMIIKEEPDAVFIGGDLIVSNRPDKDLFRGF